MDDAIRALREALSQTNGGSLRPAAEADLERANEAGFPDELLDLYRAAEPLGTVDVRSYVKDFGALSARFRKIGITPKGLNSFPLGTSFSRVRCRATHTAWIRMAEHQEPVPRLYCFRMTKSPRAPHLKILSRTDSKSPCHSRSF